MWHCFILHSSFFLPRSHPSVLSAWVPPSLFWTSDLVWFSCTDTLIFLWMLLHVSFKNITSHLSVANITHYFLVSNHCCLLYWCKWSTEGFFYSGFIYSLINMRFKVLHQFILVRFQLILSSKLVYEAFVSKCHKVWHYVMCATSATNTTKCGTREILKIFVF